MVQILSGPSPEALAKVAAWQAAQQKLSAKKLAEKIARAAAARVNPKPTTARGLRRAERRLAAAAA